MADIQKRIEQPMSNEDLEKYLAVKPADIIKYSDLSNYQTIQQLLPEVEETEVEQVVGLLAELPPTAELAPDLPLGLGFLLTLLLTVSLTFKQTT